MKETATQYTPRKQKPLKSQWLSEAAIDIVKQRSELKAAGGSAEEINKLNSDFQRQARKAKNKYYNDICASIEVDNRAGRTRDLYKKVKSLRGSFKAKSDGIRDKDGNILMDQESLKERWKEYVDDLYRKNENIEAPFTETEFTKEPGILACEVEAAIKYIADMKSAGDDNLPIELF